ncbi:hypothetical protein [Sandaracinus amylolyticus]|uniref:hypothetical protein n=1 Tax=Sandaracinus amylolyticus TaxID=927083 RepID=UPI001F2FA7DC|nr:hypothetical protein [Sandaracinus amylolyticus]UJR86196.1 Hypothetical protein I5071_82780 [Sandaracinus amylolyticus]
MTRRWMWPVIAITGIAGALWPVATRWWARRRERLELDRRIANALGDGPTEREAFTDALRTLESER